MLFCFCFCFLIKTEFLILILLALSLPFTFCMASLITDVPCETGAGSSVLEWPQPFKVHFLDSGVCCVCELLYLLLGQWVSLTWKAGAPGYFCIRAEDPVSVSAFIFPYRRPGDPA